MKRNRTDALRKTRNRSKMNRLRTAIRNVREASTPEEREQAWRKAQSLLDKAGRTRLLHPNKAKRLKRNISSS